MVKGFLNQRQTKGDVVSELLYDAISLRKQRSYGAITWEVQK